MELIDWITIAVIFALGFWAGHKIASEFHVRLFKMILQDLKITNEDLIRVARENAAEFITPEQEQKLKDIEQAGLEKIEIKVEKHGEMLYAFRNDNDQFIGQGSTREDLIAAMAERLRNVHCTVVEGSEYMKSEA